MKSPLAVPGVTLPNGVKLRKSKIRGVVSNGMLCSAVELGLGEESDGIIALADDAPAGMPLAEYLGLPDTVFDLDLTPNRGDCFSVLGVARDVAALTGSSLRSTDVAAVEATIDDTLPVEIPLPEGCPSFAGRVIRNIDPAAKSPAWMLERLRRSGLRGISPVVDITNYVMLELGQPLHAYDAARVQGAIRPRLATQGEKVTLLDEKEVSVNDDTLVISRRQRRDRPGRDNGRIEHRGERRNDRRIFRSGILAAGIHGRPRAFLRHAYRRIVAVRARRRFRRAGPRGRTRDAAAARDFRR